MFELKLDQAEREDDDDNLEFTFGINEITETDILLAIRWSNYKQVSSNGQDHMIVRFVIPVQLLEKDQK